MRGCARPTGASFAVGDVTGGPRSTHVANYHAGIVIRNALFRLPAKIDYRALPWVTYTDPELAQVELTEAAARVAGVGVRVLRWPFVENDRAQHEKEKYVQGMLICTATVAASASARSSLCDRNRRRPLAGSCSTRRCKAKLSAGVNRGTSGGPPAT
jgi:Pyridine nucleotide-disulphide oxidoreductase, dimerisation domain